MILTPRKALNKAFLKQKPTRNQIDAFKNKAIELLDQINETESEEFHKNILAGFLNQTYFRSNHYINTKGKNDLVIHNGKDAKTSVGVIIETKKPNNKNEMIQVNDLNNKALQELVLYYLRERISHKNFEIKQIIATNIYEWFIFDAQEFDRLFAQNKNLVKQFVDFEEKRLSNTKTDFFYKEIAQPAIEAIKNEIVFTHFDIRDYQKIVRNVDKETDNQLIPLYKIFSAEHLLKLPFANDSNTLDREFYTELLHIIGLTEVKDGGKKLIQRKQKSERDAGSLLENTIVQLDNLGKIENLDDLDNFGENHEEQLFSIGLELVITWINRILFLKLLEAQLINYHKSEGIKVQKNYAFLNLDKIKNFDDLNTLFFSVLARKPAERNQDLQAFFENVPYLNSSLFELAEIESKTIVISNLRDEKKLPILADSVLKDNNGKKQTGEINTLTYLFSFLNAYDFSSEGSEDIQEENKTLINASVLGLIFEKINGYQDGSFFTPGFITMYMCRETIRRTVLDKFNKPTWNDLYEAIGSEFSKQQANEIINTIKICDPAVGSGHFLVSALNELIAIKSDLKILMDKDSRTLRDFSVEVINDELVLTDDDGKEFVYNPHSKESQRVQETLFTEKQILIENCLFGVDINPNSVKICRLRLWIELLKNAYYRPTLDPLLTSPKGGGTAPSPSGRGGVGLLQTLPNIDINIKCGNSLISRFGLKTDLRQALRTRTGGASRWSIDTYKIAVQTYREAKNKEQKREMERLIAEIKSNFRIEINNNDPKKTRLAKLGYELYNRFTGNLLFEPNPKYKSRSVEKELALEEKRKAEQCKIEEEIELLKREIDAVQSNRIYDHAFEWRFEFPEVLNDEGDFMGFDIVVGNPPYLQVRELSHKIQEGFKAINPYIDIAKGGRLNLFQYFIGLADALTKKNGYTALIYQNSFLSEDTTLNARKFLFENHTILSIDSFPERDNENKRVFEDVKMSVCTTITKKQQASDFSFGLNIWEDKSMKVSKFVSYSKAEIKTLFKESYIIPSISQKEKTLFTKILGISNRLKFKVNSGELDMTATKEFFTNDKNYPLILRGAQVQRYFITKNVSQGEIKYLDTDKYFEKNNKIGRINDSQKNRIVMQRITGVDSKIRLIMTFVEPLVFCANSTNYIIGEDTELKFLLGILNSKLINYYFKTTSTNTNVTASELENMPIPIITEAAQQPFVDLVNEILELHKNISESVGIAQSDADTKNQTTNLETKIDEMVFDLYGLTQEERTQVKNASV